MSEKDTPMREDAFVRKTVPPLPVTGADLDRSVLTNLPADPARDTPYQAFRRKRHLPDTPDAESAWIAAVSRAGPARDGEDPREKLYRTAAAPDHFTGDAECGQLTQEAMQKVIDEWGNVGFKVPGYLGTPKSEDNPLEKLWREATDPKLGVPHTIPVQKLYDVASREPIESYGRPVLRTDSVESETVYRHRDSYMMEFFAYETVAATIVHAAPLVKIDREQNPEWFAALDEALAAGTAVIDENGTLWVRPDPKDYPDRSNQFVKDSMAFEAALRRSKPPAPLPDEEIGPDIVVEATDGTAQLEHRVALAQRPAELPPGG